MKKVILCLLSCFFLVACANTATQRLQIEGIQDITYEELIKNLNSSVTFMLYIGRDDCGDCQTFYPILESYISSHQGSGLYYLNIKTFRDNARKEDASQEEKAFYENLYKELHFDWTPTIHVISNGKFIETYQYLDEEYFEIEDRNQQIQRREEFLNEFQSFMDSYFEEVEQ